MGLRGPRLTLKPHRECRAMIEEEQCKLIDFIQAEKKRVTQQRNDVRVMIKTFSERSDRFRAVFDAAWDVALLPSKETHDRYDIHKLATTLRIALEKADHQWEGFAGCTFDPDPRAEQRKAGESREDFNKRRGGGVRL